MVLQEYKCFTVGLEKKVQYSNPARASKTHGHADAFIAMVILSEWVKRFSVPVCGIVLVLKYFYK